MNTKKLITNLDKVDEKSSVLRNEISKLPSSDSKTNVVNEWINLEKQINLLDKSIRDLPPNILIINRAVILTVTILLTAALTISVVLTGTYIPDSLIIDSNKPIVVMDDNPHPNRPIIGCVSVTTPEYIALFNKSFVGFVTDVNMTNRSETALITLTNGEDEITLNEYWIICADDEWFEDVYGIEFRPQPAHFDDYNGTYQLVDDWWDPISDEWQIIHTTNGKIRIEHSQINQQYLTYYYNNTYPGGTQVEYLDRKFIISHSQEEIEFTKIL